MGFKIAWFACSDRSLDSMVDALGMRRTGERDDCPDAEFCALAMPSGIALIVNSFGGDAEFLFGDVGEPILAKGELLACYINETTMMSQIASYRDGAVVWSVTHDAERGLDNLVVNGVPPEPFEDIRDRLRGRQAEPGNEADHLFELAEDLGEALTGFHHAKDAVADFEVLDQA